MYQSIFHNLSNLKPDCTDDEYTYVHRLWSLLVRLGLEDDVPDFRSEIEFCQELDDYTLRCRASEASNE